jgi:hypothetical protein
MKSIEFAHNNQIQDFIKFVFEKLHIAGNMPEIEYAQEKESSEQIRTGYYDPATNKLWIYTGNRNLIDIMRTVAHELSHHKQDQDGSTSNVDLADLESQADMAAGMIVKIYVRQHPEIIEGRVRQAQQPAPTPVAEDKLFKLVKWDTSNEI